MIELNRRAFIRSSAACAAAAVVTAEAEAADVRANASEVTGYNYRLPKINKGATLLFQGDSITDMRWGRNQNDRNHYLGHSYVYLIASRLHTDVPQADLNFLNRGISGNTVADLKARWQKDALDLKPDVLSILIGVNDVGRAVRSNKDVDVDTFTADYRSLLEQSRQANPELKIVLLEPFVLPVTRVKAEWEAWRGQIDELRPVVAKLASQYKAILLETQDVFDAAAQRAEPSHWIWDGVHPLPQGHELIARHWIESVANAWA
ncbi:MAG: SGNH/GDSL hydrolase family protein [Candidatus Nealsonbacteria bacterium]|nr:SGNH/GDSL hydrolase family protein [Candidatus Nealsonbacteria bacterium]